MNVAHARLVYFRTWCHPVADAILADHPQIEVVRLDDRAPEAENWAQMRLAHGYQSQPRTELRSTWMSDGRLLERCPNLLAVQSAGAGYDVIDVDACNAAGIVVCHQSGTNKEAVAQHVIAFMITLSKRIAWSEKMVRRAQAYDRFALSGNDITGKTVGIVGIGYIGTRVAEICGTVFGMNVIAYDPYLSEATIAARGARKVELDELLATSDFVTVHVPRTAETLGMFGADTFARMRPSTFFLNTARGGIHDETALAEALAAGQIAGAGLDVFVKEPPPPDHPLLQFDNVIFSPHIAGLSLEARYNMAAGAAEQWIDIFSGRVPPRLANPEVWPRYAERFQAIFGFAPQPLREVSAAR